FLSRQIRRAKRPQKVSDFVTLNNATMSEVTMEVNGQANPPSMADRCVMANSPESQDQLQKNPIKLAVPVSQRVQIHNIHLVACDACRSPQMDLNPDRSTIRTGVSGLSWERDIEKKHLCVLPQFTLRTLQATEKELAEVLRIVASF